ncbi:MAG: phosphatidate cytidylyltransferase [Deltaproteobacteria bacterium]|nr:phosphatidate cytidylyltransferase [Deltaproteobacteria bacterium]MBW2019693.1 phosphatidate cytidylyltransferase [Deltaproteobacteria bacterium]MBW2074540.1 phosphatidate cytidylyltransferase [Deltaproteobacteria bacterium]
MESSHLKRWLTAWVTAPLLALLIAKGGPTCFAVLVGLATVVGLLEYHALVLSGETMAVKAAGLAFGLALIACFYVHGPGVTPAVLALAFLGFAVICLVRFKPQTSVSEMLYKQVTGLVYIPFLLGHLILIRDWDQGVTWIFLVMAVVFAGDTAAYYVGNAFGKHKLAPTISPGKTIEGAAGGLAANLLVGALFKKCCFPEVGWGLWIVLMIVMGALGQIGDLVESMLKRSVGLKDAGRILPGHGGLLDRIDALLFAVPTLYYFKTYLLS